MNSLNININKNKDTNKNRNRRPISNSPIINQEKINEIINRQKTLLDPSRINFMFKKQKPSTAQTKSIKGRIIAPIQKPIKHFIHFKPILDEFIQNNEFYTKTCTNFFKSQNKNNPTTNHLNYISNHKIKCKRESQNKNSLPFDLDVSIIEKADSIENEFNSEDIKMLNL